MALTETISEPITASSDADSVRAEFRYWATTRSIDPSEAISIVNGGLADIQKHVATLSDIQGDYDHFNLAEHGFKVIEHDSALLPPQRAHFDFTNLELVTAEYWPELQELIKTQLGARSVVVMHSVVRHSTNDPHPDPYKKAQAAPSLAPAKPFHVVHNDYSAHGSRTVLRAMLTSFFEDSGCLNSTTSKDRDEFFSLRDEILAAEERGIEASGASSHLTWNGSNYAGPRWGIFSIWRPLETVQQDPLALIDPHSLFTTNNYTKEEYKSYMALRMMHYNRVGFVPQYEITNIMPMLPRAEHEHKWYWVRDQRPNQVYAIKLFDSEAWKEGNPVVPCAPHSAFTLPNSTTLPPRKSIESRVLVVW